MPRIFIILVQPKTRMIREGMGMGPFHLLQKSLTEIENEKGEKPV